MYYAYVLKNPKGVLYKGSTDNLKTRIDKHNGGFYKTAYTRRRGPWLLAYYEVFESRKDALMREKYFKTGAGRDFLKNKI